MTVAPVPLAAQIAKVEELIKRMRHVITFGSQFDLDLHEKNEQIWLATLATLQQYERARAALREIADMEGREGMTDYKFAEAALRLANDALDAANTKE